MNPLSSLINYFRHVSREFVAYCPPSPVLLLSILPEGEDQIPLSLRASVWPFEDNSQPSPSLSKPKTLQWLF